MFSENETPGYLTEQLITYIGNKRSLLNFIGSAVETVRARLGKEKITIADLFAGSGVVSRYFKRFASRLEVNDLERYSEVVNLCYLANPSALDIATLKTFHTRLLERLEAGPLEPGLISELYAPRDDRDIGPGERVFYTTRNARYLDTARALIEEVPPDLRVFFLGPLLAEASVHANTAGVFKGFYRDANTQLGRFGGTNGDALERILGDVALSFPIFSAHECDVTVRRADANDVARGLGHVDLVYLDPPYNQHPYGSNYFMLNLIVQNERPAALSKVSGIPADWRRSTYNARRRAFGAFEELVRSLDARYLLVSFNSEGFIGREQMMTLLSSVGRVELFETRYNTFRGSRNLRDRSLHVKEYLYLVEKAS
ncbi:MAG: DNA modification methylase [Spirochaetaceae bacterium]|nr:MAG: DNA modification methylase [Spirochaetaceae bacterium]